jgi:hypothetical protein
MIQAPSEGAESCADKLTDKEWTAIRPMLPNDEPRGVPRVNDLARRRLLTAHSLKVLLGVIWAKLEIFARSDINVPRQASWKGPNGGPQTGKTSELR